jgi:putative addiction module component (TIGR02574 family)
MSEAAVQALAAVRGLSAADRRWVQDRLDADDSGLDPATFHPDDVPADVQEEILAEFERRMAAYEADPQPLSTADEVIDRILARRAARRAAS